MRDDAFLKDCLVDGEAGTRRRTSKTRRRAVAAALVLEGVVISGLALWPLFTPATPPPKFMVVTSVPYLSGARLPRPTRASAQNAGSRRIIPVPDFSRPLAARVVRMAGSEIQSMSAPVIGNPGPGAGDGIAGPPGDLGNAPITPPAPTTVRVIRRSEQIQESQLIKRVMPDYPQIARVAHVTGAVELLVLVARDGGVLSVQVLSGNPLLAAAAKQAVEQWRYRPAILDGQAVEVEARVTVNFVMDE